MGFDLGAAIREALAATRDAARLRGLRVTLSMPARAVHVAADVADVRARLDHCLQAMLAALPDGAALRIEVRCDGGVAHVTIDAARMSLPLAPPRAPPALAAAPVRADGPLAGLRVLVADDSRDAANGLATLLRLAGADAWAVFGGQTAIDHAAERRPHAVVLDLDMPGVDGLAAARRISAKDDACMLIALTGATRADDRARTRRAGFRDHLVKPVDVGALTALLGRIRPVDGGD